MNYNIHFLNYHVNDNHSFLCKSLTNYDNFISKYSFYTQTCDNTFISEDTKEINYNNAAKELADPRACGYIIVDDGEYILNFIVTGWQQISSGVIKFYVKPDIFRNDLNRKKYIVSVIPYGAVEQCSYMPTDVDKSQIVPYDLGDPVGLVSETYPLIDSDNKNWVVIVCGESDYLNYGVYASKYADDRGTMTTFARKLALSTAIIASTETNSHTFKPLAVYVVPKTLIADGYDTVDYYYNIGSQNPNMYPINAYFKKTALTFDTSPLYKYDFGTIAKRVKINKQFSEPIYVITSFNSSDISIAIQYNNIFIDVTDEFEYPITTDEFAQYAALNKKSMAIKGVTSAVSIATGVATNNPLAIVGGVLSAGSSLAEMADKSDMPYTVTGNNNGCANITHNNGFSLRQYTCRNYNDVKRVVDTFGYKYQSVNKFLSDIIATSATPGKTFVKYKFISSTSELRAETFTRLLNGVFV